MLVHGKTKKLVNSGKENMCCCRVCHKISHDEIFNTAGSESFRPVKFGKCTDRNVIYGLIYTKCVRIVYVRETKRSLKERFAEHVRDVRTKRRNL